MNERIPDKIIVLERGTGKYVVCVLQTVDKGVPIYKPDSFRVYEHLNDAARAVSEATKEPPKV